MEGCKEKQRIKEYDEWGGERVGEHREEKRRRDVKRRRMKMGERG